MTVNQILVGCLVLILIVFLVFIGKLAITGIGLLKDTKKLVGEAGGAVESGKKLAEECGDKAKEAAQTLMDNASPIAKGAGILAAGFCVINFGWLIRRRFLLGRGVVASYFAHRAQKKTEKDLIQARKEVTKLRKQAKRNAKATKKARKIAEKLN